MFNFSDLADSVSRWTSLGVALPKPLAEAIDVFETLRYTEVGYHPAFSVEDVTPANAEAKIRELAEEFALSRNHLTKIMAALAQALKIFMGPRLRTRRNRSFGAMWFIAAAGMGRPRVPG